MATTYKIQNIGQQVDSNKFPSRKIQTGRGKALKQVPLETLTLPSLNTPLNLTILIFLLTTMYSKYIENRKCLS